MCGRQERCGNKKCQHDARYATNSRECSRIQLIYAEPAKEYGCHQNRKRRFLIKRFLVPVGCSPVATLGHLLGCFRIYRFVPTLQFVPVKSEEQHTRTDEQQHNNETARLWSQLLHYAEAMRAREVDGCVVLPTSPEQIAELGRSGIC